MPIEKLVTLAIISTKNFIKTKYDPRYTISSCGENNEIIKDFLEIHLVGIVNTLLGTAVMSFSELQLLDIKRILGSILSYFLNKYFTFQNTPKRILVIAKFIIKYQCMLFNCLWNVETSYYDDIRKKYKKMLQC